MKRFLKSAFGLNLSIILFFAANTVYFYKSGQLFPAEFCASIVVVFAMILPLCSTRN